MAELKILQEQFQHAANDFPHMMHFIQHPGSDGTLPIELEKISEDPHCIAVWDENIQRKPDERGYPVMHYLLAPPYPKSKWDVIAVYDRLMILASKANKVTLWRIDRQALQFWLPFWLPFWVNDLVEYWLLFLQHMRPQPQLTTIYHTGIFDPDSNIEVPETRWAEKGESYHTVVEDVFLESALLCGTLIELGQELQRKSRQLITLAIAVQNFEVSRSTLNRRIKNGTLKDYRGENAAKNSPVLVDAVELAKHYNRRS